MKRASRIVGDSTALFIAFVVAVSMFSFGAAAWGVTVPVNNLVMHPGDSSEVGYTLQNYVGDKTLRIVASVAGDSEVAEIVGENAFTLPPKTKDVPLTLRISIPSDAKYAKSHYDVQLKLLSGRTGSGMELVSEKVVSLGIDVPAGEAGSSTSASSANLAGASAAGRSSQEAGNTNEAAGTLGGGASENEGEEGEGEEESEGLLLVGGKNAASSTGSSSSLIKFIVLGAIVLLAITGYWQIKKNRSVELI